VILFRDKYVILDPNASPPGEIHAGLNRNDHPRLENSLDTISDSGLLVNI